MVSGAPRRSRPRPGLVTRRPTRRRATAPQVSCGAVSRGLSGPAHPQTGVNEPGIPARSERAMEKAPRAEKMVTHERPFGRYFEDFEPGDVYKHWPGKTITEADDHLFCLITMNHHPLHLDQWYAETQTQFGKNVVVGNLVYSLVLGMSVPDVSGAAIANLEVHELRHKS